MVPNAGVGYEVVKVLVSDLGHLVGIIGGGNIIAEPDVVRIAVVRAVLPAWWRVLWRPVVDCRAAHKEGGKEVELHRVPCPGAAAAKEAGNGGWSKSQCWSKKTTDGSI